MKISKQIKDRTLTLFFEGNLDESSADTAERSINDAFSNGFDTVKLDLGKVVYISSIGIRVLIYAYKKGVKAGMKVGITNMSPKVSEILNMVGILKLFT